MPIIGGWLLGILLISARPVPIEYLIQSGISELQLRLRLNRAALRAEAEAEVNTEADPPADPLPPVRPTWTFAPRVDPSPSRPNTPIHQTRSRTSASGIVASSAAPLSGPWLSLPLSSPPLPEARRAPNINTLVAQANLDTQGQAQILQNS